MADGTTFVKVTSTQSTPEDYLLSGAASVDLLAVRAEFDGSGAAGDFVPVVQIVNEADEVMLTFTGEKVTAGDSASITFAPFLRGQAASTPAGSGIQFNTDNEGGYLYVATDARSPASPPPQAGLVFVERSGWGVILQSLNVGNIELNADGDIHLFSDDGGQIYLRCSGVINLESDGDAIALSSASITTINAVGGIALNPDTGVSGTNYLTIANLPTLNPGGSGIVWNNGGVLSIT